MNYIDWLGFTGVFQILLAYFLNVTKKVNTNNLVFILLNLVGASFACLASILLNYVPFVVVGNNCDCSCNWLLDQITCESP